MYQSISKKHVHTHGQLSNASSLSKEKLLYARCTTSPSHINVIPCARSTCGIHFYVASHSVSSKLSTRDYSLSLSHKCDGSTFMWFPIMYPQSFQLETIHCPSHINMVPCAGSTCGIYFYVVSHKVSSKLSTRDYSLFATGGP